MRISAVSSKKLNATSYAAATTVSIEETLADIGKLVTHHHGKLLQCQQTATGGTIEFQAGKIPVRFSVLYPSAANYKNTGKWEQAKKSIWRALFLTIKAKFISIESGIEAPEEAFMAQIMQKDGQLVGAKYLPTILHELEQPQPQKRTPNRQALGAESFKEQTNQAGASDTTEKRPGMKTDVFGRPIK